MAETDSTAFVAMVKSKPFQVFLAAIHRKSVRATARLENTGTWDDACRLQGEIRGYKSLAELASEIEHELKEREKRG